VDEVLAALADQQEELDDLLDGLDDRTWASPSGCEGWSIGDVVLHLAQSNEMAIGSAHGDLDGVLARLLGGVPPSDGDIDDGAALMVAAQRGARPGELRERWERSCSDLRAALGARSPADRVPWLMGDIAARTLATTRLAETWIHSGDVADGLGIALEPSDRLWHVARLAWRTIPYAFERAGEPPPGAVSFDLSAPSGERWSFGDSDAPTLVRGPGHDLCLVASRRVAPGDTALNADGPDAGAVLRLVRTWA
jgi:uncharacterized protein (TIGR03084 family)